jgi:integrase
MRDKLTAKGLKAILTGTDKDRKREYGDGAGLTLVIKKRDPNGRPLTSSWTFRYMLDGVRREVGIGPAAYVGLADARQAADTMRGRVKAHGIDVLTEKREAKQAKRAQARKPARMTFRAVANGLMDAMEAEWRNPKSRASWQHTLEDYAYPIIGDLDPARIDTAEIVQVIEPIWLRATETASRLRGRIEKVLDRAKVMGLRKGDNPARWKGHLEHLLPRKSKVAPVEHHAALDYRQIGTFVAELRQQGGIAARALEFAILTWGRTGEVMGMRWAELNDAEKMWIVPAARMKANREHRVPLCDRAIEILAEMRDIRSRRPSEYVFQGLKDGQPLSNMAFMMTLRRMGHPELTAHGFRATARTWAAEQTNFPHELCELALAHIVSNKTEAPYNRGPGLQKRHQMAEAWCRFCSTPAIEGEVIAINAA